MKSSTSTFDKQKPSLGERKTMQVFISYEFSSFKFTSLHAPNEVTEKF